MAEPALPPNLSPALRAAVEAALAWLRELDEAASAGPAPGLRRPR